MPIKWCYRWPYCQCGIAKSRELQEEGQKMLVFRDGVGDLKRIPVSEILSYAITEEIQEGRDPEGCPRTEA